MKVCQLCQKGTQIVGGYSNRTRATQYNPTGKNRKKPNLQSARKLDGQKILICTNCLKKNKHLA